MPETTTQVRDAEATQARILAAAKLEFARLGLGGARVDEIALKAKANKRMIYHYFGSKEALFARVLEDAYVDIRSAERELDLEHMPARQALKTLVEFTWHYYLENPEFIRLVNSENLHEARHIRGSQRLQEVSRAFTGMVGDILKRGEQEGVFRKGLDPIQLNITIAAIGYYYLTNRFTGEFLFEKDFMTEEALEARLAFNLDTIMRLVQAD
ncbi:MAG: TetR family transcriptional regulator [Silicimonas sp.]|jgi:AcrR family transcriptional regulator|nr:TetR family transcriptional regulator [Silicimonas sp.]